MFNLLLDSIIGVLDIEGRREHLSLPQLYFKLGRDMIATFPALRPHQRHAWHALLCQLGALACLKSGLSVPPNDADGWRAALRGLTPEFPRDEPWMLVTSPDKPAFLQAVVGAPDGFKPLSTPDELDMLVTANNHDLKRARLSSAAADDWLFALITLQTMEGIHGRGNYGISRMNGGHANRPGFSISPPGCVGAHVMRDLKRLIALRDNVLENNAVFDQDGLALVWLRPWNGACSLQPMELDPYFIEICRRVRLISHAGRLSALAAGSEVARIIFGKDAKGLTGDPWTPIEIKDGEAKALTVDARGFSYKRLSDILFEKGFRQASLQQIGRNDPQGCSYHLICRALARGQGKTEGLHERRIVVPPKAVGYWRSHTLEPLALLAQDRIEQAGKIRGALRYALMMLFQNGPERPNLKQRHKPSEDRAAPFLDMFETEIDRDFFFGCLTKSKLVAILTRTSRSSVRCALTGSSIYAHEPRQFSRLPRLVRPPPWFGIIARGFEPSGHSRAHSSRPSAIHISRGATIVPRPETQGAAAATAIEPGKKGRTGLVEAFAGAVRASESAERRGDLASLRRLNTGAPDAPAFFRIVVTIAPEASPAAVHRYARFLQILALKPAALASGSFGAAMAGRSF
jgi:CRISPR system Cascade subunit CasA